MTLHIASNARTKSWAWLNLFILPRANEGLINKIMRTCSYHCKRHTYPQPLPGRKLLQIFLIKHRCNKLLQMPRNIRKSLMRMIATIEKGESRRLTEIGLLVIHVVMICKGKQASNKKSSAVMQGPEEIAVWRYISLWISECWIKGNSRSINGSCLWIESTHLRICHYQNNFAV